MNPAHVWIEDREWMCRTAQELANVIKKLMADPRTEVFHIREVDSKTKWTITKEVV